MKIGSKDLVGFSLGEAKRLIDEAGLKVKDVLVLSPPREKTNEYNEDYRVIRINMISDTEIELTVCKPL